MMYTNNFKKLLFLLIILFFNNINCQLTPKTTPITTLTIKEVDSNQKYYGYPKQSNSGFCHVEMRFIVKDTSVNNFNSIFTLNSSDPLINFNIDKEVEYGISIFSISSNSFNSSKIDLNTTYTFEINAYTNYSNKVTYEINYVCYYPDTSNVLVEIFNENCGILVYGYTYQALKVSGLNFNFDTLQSPDYSQVGTAWGYNLFLSAFFSDSRTFNMTFIIWDRVFTVSSTNPLYVSEISTIDEIVTYPSSLVGDIKQFGVGLSPLYTYKTNSTQDFPPVGTQRNVFPIPLRGYRGNMTYIYNFLDSPGGGPTVNILQYFNGTSYVILLFNVEISNFFPQVNPYLNLNLGNESLFEIPMFQISFNTSPNYFYVYSHSYQDVKIYQIWPFGFVSGNNYNCTSRITIQMYRFSPYIQKPYQVSVTPFDSSNSPSYHYVPRYNDKNVIVKEPQLISYEFKHIIGTMCLVRIRVYDKVGLNRIVFGSLSPINIRIGESLVKGDIFNGTYEFTIDISQGIRLIMVNCYDVLSLLDHGSFISVYPVIFQYLSPIDEYDVKRIDSVLSVTFLHYDSLVDDEYHNIAYIQPNLSLLPSSQGIKFMIRDKSSLDSYNGIHSSWNAVWDETKGVFVAKFILPKGSMYGIVQYILSISPPTIIFSIFFPSSSQLKVDSLYYYQSGPIFSNFEKYPKSDGFFTIQETGGSVGWKITVEDYYGFRKGYIKVIGSVDNSIYHFNFTLSNAINTSSLKSSISESVYYIALNISSPCVSQDYLIDIVELEGITGLKSLFKMYEITPDPIKNPFRLFLSDPLINRINIECVNPSIDISPPKLVDFNISTNSMDVSSLNRKVTFNFIALDIETGLKDIQYPIVYLLGKRMEIIECVSRIVSINNISASYKCSIDLPYGFGYPDPIIVSVYGFINNGGYYSGFSSFDLQSSGYQYYINTTLASRSLFIRSNEVFFSDGGDLVLYGNGFEKINSITLKFFDPSRSVSSSFSSNFSTVITIKNVLATNKPFTINFKDQFSVESNEYTVFPIFFSAKEPTPEPTPEPTSSPTKPILPTPTPTESIKCPGTPEPCGGSKKGYCNNDGNCICFSPFVGYSCSSQVIIVPQPSANTTSPTIEIPTTNENTTISINVEKIFYKSLISMVSIRELDFNGNQVKLYPFDKWIYKKINDNTNLYLTNITSTTNITVQLQWFTNESIINFAGFNLLMNPSTIKYTVEINQYPFESTLNQLQLIMSTSFSASKSYDICSNKEFVSDDDDSNYLKMQIDDHSLYGRFIKRAIIDGIPKTVDNLLLDSNLNVIINQNDEGDGRDTASEIQSFIGITIPSYNENIIIDPDFSVLIDSSSPTESSKNNGNTICNISKSGLTSAQLVGIIVGSVAFATVLLIISAYAIYQHRRNRIFISKIEKKMKNVN